MQKRFYSILLLLFITTTGFISMHKYYVSVTDINYSPTEKSLQIIARVFVDDFEAVLQKRYNDSLLVTSPNAKFYISRYFNKKLTIDINKHKTKLQYIGSEIEDDLLLCYFEIPEIPKINHIKISNQLLFDHNQQQQNITHLKINNTQKSFLFIKDRYSESLNL